ncbi:hypothetical protein B0I37DRAFT_386908 [Chaetomium sp. MPI-CAGE-AT-0009]|nr:hypothetical protein B0I37DRAFT_386908 [Chaetomium sp. MPI-CAGE-AT-0009]
MPNPPTRKAPWCFAPWAPTVGPECKASHKLLVARVAVDDLFGPCVGSIGFILAIEHDGGLDVVDVPGPGLGTLELAAGPFAEIGNHLLQCLIALEAVLLVRHGVALLLGPLFAVLANLFELVLGHDVEFSRHVGNGAKCKQCHDCQEEDLEVVHLEGAVGSLGVLVVFLVFVACLVVFPTVLLVPSRQGIYGRGPPCPDGYFGIVFALLSKDVLLKASWYWV